MLPSDTVPSMNSEIINTLVAYAMLPFLLLILIGIGKTAWFKGMIGEWMVNVIIRLFLDKHSYHLVHNVTLPTEDGGSTQIDHIIVSRYGVFVVETKHMKGWIFGSAQQKQWTQKIYRYTGQFQNPLHQNYKHTKVLAACLGIDHDTLHSVVVFVGDFKFKTNMPENVVRSVGLLRFVRAQSKILFTPQQTKELLKKIQRNRLEPSFATHKRHVRHVKEIQQKKQPRPRSRADGSTHARVESSAK